MASASHPLITDDAGTQGKGKYQLEVNGEYLNINGNTTTELSATFSAGITDNLDLVVGLPYQFLRTKDEDGNRTTENGMSDASIELKWRFFEKNGLSLALKPGVTLPSGDDEKGLGAGRATFSLFFITTKEVAPWVFHFNLGYTRNENMNDERRDIYHASLASEFEAVKNLKVVANIGGDTNADRGSNIHPIFLLGGSYTALQKISI